MDNLGKVILNTVIIFILTFILNIFISSLEGNGKIGIGQVINIKGMNYSIVEIENYSSDTIAGLKLDIPSGVIISNIISSAPISIIKNEKIINIENFNQIELSEIAPNSTLKVLIPRSLNSQIIRSVNHEELKLSLYDSTKVTDPLKESALNVLIMSIVYTVLFFIFELKGQQRANELQKQTGSMTERLDSIENKVSEDKDRCRKFAILYQARLSDYSKELTFWRDTIRKIIFESTKEKLSSELLINEVTKSLKTFGTKTSKNIDFDTIEVMAKYLKKDK